MTNQDITPKDKWDNIREAATKFREALNEGGGCYEVSVYCNEYVGVKRSYSVTVSETRRLPL